MLSNKDIEAVLSPLPEVTIEGDSSPPAPGRRQSYPKRDRFQRQGKQHRAVGGEKRDSFYFQDQRLRTRHPGLRRGEDLRQVLLPSEARHGRKSTGLGLNF